MRGAMKSQRRWSMRAGAAALAVLSWGCTPRAMSPPPRPVLPEVRYVAPGNTAAVVGLTQEGVDTLRLRDVLWQRHIELLEQQLREGKQRR
jgi:hypothetical protein